MLIDLKGRNYTLRTRAGICWLRTTGEEGEKPPLASFVLGIADSFLRRHSTRDRRKAVRDNSRVPLDNRELRDSEAETVQMDTDKEETTTPIVRSWVSVAR